MAATRKTKSLALRCRDPKKEGLFKELASKFLLAGYQVRRERLRSGYGFKVVSGSCRVNSDQVVFVDSRLNQDEQLEFLRSRAADLGVRLG